MGISDIRARFISAIDRHALITPGETLIAGLSGGPDSVSLLHLLDGIKKRYSLRLHAVYVDHNLRPDETPLEIEFCRRLCDGLGINFVVKAIDVISYQKRSGLGRQEAARELRYKAFDEACLETGASKICLAHNADDQAETVLMRLVRGSGPGGLAGIPVRRGRIVRPLIEIGRSEIESYIEENGLEYMVDSSNLKTDYLRNRIRLTLMPELKKLNPKLLAGITSTVSVLQEEERYLGIHTTKALMRLISRKTLTRIELFLRPMETLDKVILRRVLRRAIDETSGIRGIGFGHIEDIIALISDGRAGDRLYLPKGIRVIRQYALLVITSDLPIKISEYTLNPGDEVAVAGAGVVLKAGFEEVAGEPGDGKTSVTVDADKITLPLLVRARRPGDYFYPAGFGRKKKLQDYFVDEKIPRDERDSVPLVFSGADLVCVAGHRADERFRPGPDTKKFLRLVIVSGKF